MKERHIKRTPEKPRCGVYYLFNTNFKSRDKISAGCFFSFSIYIIIHFKVLKGVYKQDIVLKEENRWSFDMKHENI